MKDSILNYEYIEEFITTNLGEDVKYRWSHGATKRHIGDCLIIYTLINFFKRINNSIPSLSPLSNFTSIIATSGSFLSISVSA